MSSKRTWKKAEPYVKPVIYGKWVEYHDNRCGKTFFEYKGHVYYIYRCRCGSRFYIHEMEHRLGREAPGTTLDADEKSVRTAL